MMGSTSMLAAPLLASSADVHLNVPGGNNGGHLSTSSTGGGGSGIIMSSPNHVTTINIAPNNHRGSTTRSNVGLGHEGKYTPSNSASRLALSSMTSLAHYSAENNNNNFLHNSASNINHSGHSNQNISNNNNNNNSHGNYVDIDQLDQMRFNGSGSGNGGGVVGDLSGASNGDGPLSSGQSYFPSFMRNYSINQKHPPSSLDLSPAASNASANAPPPLLSHKLSPQPSSSNSSSNNNVNRGSAMTLMYGGGGGVGGGGGIAGGGGDESPIYENQFTMQNLHPRAESPIYSNTSSTTSSVAVLPRSLYDYQTEQNIRNVLNLQQVQYPVPPIFPQLRYATTAASPSTTNASSPTNPSNAASSSQSLYSNLPPQSPNYYTNVMPSAAALLNVPLYSNVGQPQPGSGMTFGEHFVHNKRHNNYMDGGGGVVQVTGEGVSPTEETAPQEADTELPLPPGWSIGEWRLEKENPFFINVKFIYSSAALIDKQ